MDCNLALVGGRLAVPPHIEERSDGSRSAHLLVHVRSERRQRFDVVPVVVPEHVGAIAVDDLVTGSEVYVAGRLIRRSSWNFWEPSERIEVVADSIRLADVEGGRRAG